MDWYNQLFCGMSYAKADIEAMKFNAMRRLHLRIDQMSCRETASIPKSALREFLNINILHPMVKGSIKSIVFSSLVKLVARHFEGFEGDCCFEDYRRYRDRITGILCNAKGFKLQRFACDFGPFPGYFSDGKFHLVNLNVQ